MKFRILSDEEVAEHDAANAEYYAAEDERQRRVKACPGHSWEMLLYDPEDDVHVSLRCEHCPAGVDDVFMDGADLLYAEFDGGVDVVGGLHNSPVALVVPVSVEVWGSKTWTDYGWDYDAGIEVEQRGPARPMFPDGVS